MVVWERVGFLEGLVVVVWERVEFLKGAAGGGMGESIVP